MPTAGMRGARARRAQDELAGVGAGFDVMADKLRANRRRITRLLPTISHECSALRACASPSGLARQPPASGRQMERLDAKSSARRLIGQDEAGAPARSDAHFEREQFDLDEVIEQSVGMRTEGAVKAAACAMSARRTPKSTAIGELLGSAMENVLRQPRCAYPVGIVGGGVRRTAGRPRVGSSYAIAARRAGGRLGAYIDEPFYRVAKHAMDSGR